MELVIDNVTAEALKEQRKGRAQRTASLGQRAELGRDVGGSKGDECLECY